MLEKIFEEMEKGKSTVKILGREVDFVPLEWAKNILRRRMNDDTTIGINIDDERFWKILFDEACVEGKQAERIYANLRKIRNDGWVPVEERLPEEHEESRDRLDADTLAVIDTEHNMVSDLVQCTVYDAEKDEYFVCDDCTVNGKWCNFEEVTGTYKVIAWQPLPEPYRPEKGETDGDNNL